MPRFRQLRFPALWGLTSQASVLACVGMTGIFPFFPTKGVLFESERHAIFSEFLAVNFNFARSSFDGHKSPGFARDKTLPLKRTDAPRPEACPFKPCRHLAVIQYLRGMYCGRFRDKDFDAGSSRVQIPDLMQCLGGAVFTGLGE